MIDGVSKTIIDDADNHIDSFKSNDREDDNDPQEWQNILLYLFSYTTHPDTLPT